MYLTLRTFHGKKYLYMMESIHVAGKRNPKKRTVKSYGLYDNVSEDIRKAFEDSRAKKELERKLEHEMRMAELNNAHYTLEREKILNDGVVPSSTDTNFNKAQALRYGHLPLKRIWDRDLNLRYKLKYLQEHHTDIESWSINDLLFYLCALKIIAPSSYLSASEGKANYLYCPWANVLQDNFYHVLDFVSLNGDELIEHAVKSHHSLHKQEIKVAFFDCTNTYFETPYDDVAWQTIRFVREKRKEKYEEGLTVEQTENYFKSDEFARELADELELRKEDVIRMRGPSKEGRFSLPIVTVALAIDQNGFPIDCEVFAGNTSELKTINPMLSSLKKKYDVKDVYFVADRGLNSFDTLNELQKSKLGFVVAQKVSHQQKAQREEMLSLDGYRNCTFNDLGDIINDDTKKELDANAFRYKVCTHKKVSRELNTDKDARTKYKKVELECKIIYTFSPERKKRDLADLDEQIAKARKAVDEGKLMGNAFGTGWRGLIETKKEAAKTKKDKDQYRAIGVKKEVIADRRACAGYSAIVFDDPEGLKEGKFSTEDVLSTYHRLVRIEDCFRVMKGNFSIRPVYLRLKERIIAHCKLCVLSLMMLRTLQMKLEAQGTPMSSERVCEALKQALVVPVPAKKGEAQAFLNVGLNQNFNDHKWEKRDRRQFNVDSTVDEGKLWELYEKERTAQPDDLDNILKAVDLKPLRVYSSLGDLKIRLGIKNAPNDIMIAKEHLMLMDKIASSL